MTRMAKMVKLPFFQKFIPQSKLASEPLLAVEVSETKKVKLALWEINEEQKERIFKKAFYQYQGEWEAVMMELSQAILRLIKEADLDRKVKKIIFGLPTNFIDKEKIKEPYLGHFKKLCQQLSLSPLGFIEIPQAIALYLKQKEGRLPTVILFNVNDSYSSVNVFKLGEEIGRKTIAFKENIALSLSQTLKEFAEIQTFPAKILLYDGQENLEAVKEELLSYPWQREAGFVHFPKIEILDEDFSLLALVAGGASQFAKELEKTPVEEEVSKEEVAEAVSSQELGFLKEEDVAKKKSSFTKAVEDKEEKKIEKETDEAEFETEEEVGESGIRTYLSSFLGSFSLKPDFKRIGMTLFFLGSIFSVIIYYFYWQRPQVKIKIYVEPRLLEKETEVVLNLNPEKVDQSTELLGKEVAIEKIGSETVGVTTKKDVGEPAQGEVTIYNKTTNEKSFNKGTVLIGPKNLKFTLDEQVTIASVSDLIAGTAGKGKVKVTAKEIGPEGNLAAGSDFKFEDYPISSYAARNENAFSGGSSREVTVVGKKDQDKVLNSLQEKLTKEAEEGLQEKLTSSERLLSETMEKEVVEEKFNHHLDEETSELSLDLTMKFKAVSFNEDDLNEFLKKIAEEKAPSGYKFDQEGVEMEVVSVEKEDDKISFKAHFKVKLIPEIKTEELKNSLVRKSTAEVKDYLKNLSNIAGYEINFLNYPPLMGKKMPFSPQKISIEIVPF